MRLKLLLVLALGCACAALPAAAQQGPHEGRDMMRSLGIKVLSPKKMAKAVAKAERSPLGSKANPVRENMPEGERAYLRRLRCSGGQPPAFERKGSVGLGPYGSILDLYSVACPGAAPAEVYMDMYHYGPENRPLPGFTIAPPEAGGA